LDSNNDNYGWYCLWLGIKSKLNKNLGIEIFTFGANHK